jgi:glycosyltransferase involved in cell wall biosynthesis
MSRSIRALYLQPAAQFGGAERQAATIVPMLDEHGVETIPVVGPGHQIVEWLRERGVTDLVHSSAFPGAVSPPPSSRLRALRRYTECVLRFRRELTRIAQEQRIDVIIAAMAFSWVSATKVARALDVPIVWRAGGTELTPMERVILGAWARWNPPDQLICNGDSVARMFGGLIGAPTSVIRNGLDHRQFHPGAASPETVRAPDGRIVIGFAGRLVPQKRPQDFIAAASRLAKRDDVAFLVAGDGSQREQYLELARRAGAPIEAVGYVHDIRAFYAACDVLVLPSRSEGCPNVVLEAMAMETAVIAADAAATREIVTHGRDGLLYPIGDVDALVAHLTSIVERPLRRASLIERALERVRDFSAHECAARTAALLREIATARPRRSLRAQPPDTDLLVSHPA